MKKLLILFFLVLTMPLVLKAQEENKDEMDSDRPSFSFTPKTVAKNRFQLETGFQKQHDKKNGQQQDRYLYPTALLKYGLTNKVEVRVLLEYEGDYDYTPNKHKLASGLNL